jgi:hypothetical protein
MSVSGRSVRTLHSAGYTSSVAMSLTTQNALYKGVVVSITMATKKVVTLSRKDQIDLINVSKIYDIGLRLLVADENARL